MSAFIDAVDEITGLPLKSASMARICRCRRVLSDELGCPHDQLVFDDINDVHCDHCGKDFTG
jgi:hypothetical protein